MIAGYHLWAPPHAYADRRLQNSVRMQYNSVLTAKAEVVRKGWVFQVSTWNADSLTGRAGELIEALVDKEVDVACVKKHDGEVVVANSWELKANDISCSGWEVKRDLTV